MSVPSNVVQFPGLGSVTADNFNTYIQSCLNYAQLRTFTGQTYMLAQVEGATSPADGGQGLYWYNAQSTAIDNNASVIVPFGAVQGAWLLLPPVLPPAINNVRYVATGTADAAQVTDQTIVWTSPIAASKSEILPAPTSKGQTFTVKDGLGNSAQYPITISASAGTFSGDSVIDTPFAALTFTADGTSIWLVTQAYLPNTYVVQDASAWGLVGDGTTDNTTLMQAMFTAAGATGGLVRFPPGVFKITSSITCNINSNVGLSVVGSGQEVTQILCAASSGLVINYGNPYSSLNMRDMTFVTDQTGGHTGVTLALASGVSVDQAAGGPPSIIENIFFRGSDLDSANVNYWGVGFMESGVSNINIIGGGVTGAVAPSTLGTAYSLNGNGSTPFYSVQINLYGVGILRVSVGLFYGDFVQGVTLDAVNMTGCATGVLTPTSPTGTLDQLSAVNSQMNCSTVCIHIADTNTSTSGFVGLYIANNTFICESGSTGIILNGTGWLIQNNSFGSVATTALYGIRIVGNAASGGVIAGNTLEGFSTAAISVVAEVGAQAFIKWNNFLGNTVDYDIGSGAGGIIISDDLLRNFADIPTCTTGINASSFKIADSTTATFNASVTTGGGSDVGFVLCVGGTYKFH